MGFRTNTYLTAAVMFAAAGFSGWTLPAGSSTAEGGEPAAPFRQRIPVPPLPETATWLNTDGPHELSDFRGKFVLLDFWTYCCINCMHILPELDKLEKAYPKNLVVIGVHSAKFETEKDTQNIIDAIQRYEIKHPVINDANHVIWDRFSVRVWPTVLLIDPEGYAVWGTSGEITADQVETVLRRAIPYYREKGLLEEKPLVFDREAAKLRNTPLRFPGKVLADESTDRLFVADSNHNRIVVATLDGALVDIIGSGQIGMADGDFASASFNHPQGMALRGNVLFVADTENHAIREVDLTARMVATVAGTGEQNRQRPSFRASDPAKTPLSSPWALCVRGNDLFIAMAGTHQIWRMRISGNGSTIIPYAGNGREDIVDGRRLPQEPYELGFASFAQPSGLTSDARWLYVADSEGSSIRAVPFNPTGEVKTVVGTSNLPNARLFTFGDVDGPAGSVRLQHALGIVYHQDVLYIADTYNNKIKAVDPGNGSTRTIAGTGEAGASDSPATFNEPAGVTAAGGKLYVADTNNHVIRVVDLANDNRVSTLEIVGLLPPKKAAQ